MQMTYRSMMTFAAERETHSEWMFSGLLRLERPCFCALGSLRRTSVQVLVAFFWSGQTWPSKSAVATQHLRK
jgi:hypothetical protein